MCEGRSEDLVRYPTTLAPASGSVTVTVQCADNAHTTNYTRPNVTCTSNGSWSGQIPQCKCDDGYREVTLNGTRICQGQQPLSRIQITDITSGCVCACIYASALMFLFHRHKSGDCH